MPPRLRQVLLAAPVLLLLALPFPRADAGQVACSTVISAINVELRKGMGKSPDISTLAKHLGTNPVWVEHCMEVYGRRLRRRPAMESAEGREGRLERYEDHEEEEQLPEDAEAPDLELPTKQEKQRALRLKKTPTPGGFRD